MKQHKLKGVYELNNRLLTINLTPKKKVYDEILIKKHGKEYRTWNPEKSKLAAAIKKGANQIGIMPGKTVLYLGASTGTTVSHVSDIVGNDGFVFAVEFGPRVARELVFLCQERPNIAPILADANKPETYKDRIFQTDVLFQDIAQRNQVEIFLKNLPLIKPNGYGLLALKARSVDVSRKPKAIFNETRELLKKHVTIVDYRTLDPFEQDHAMFIVKPL